MSNTPKLLELFYLLFLNSPKKRNRFFWGIGAAAFIILPPLIPISVIDFWKNIDSVICWGYVCGLAQVATEHPFFLSYSQYVFAVFLLLNALLVINSIRYLRINFPHTEAQVWIGSTCKFISFLLLTKLIVYLSVRIFLMPPTH